MKPLQTAEAPFVRTDFSNDAAWNQLVETVLRRSDEGFVANITIVSDENYDGADPTALANAAAGHNHAVLFVADEQTFRSQKLPILCIDMFRIGGKFRVLPADLWGIENNLSLSNMDFEEFADWVDQDGVFKGFE